MSQFFILFKREYLSDFRSKSFWITTIIMPLLLAAFALCVGFFSSNLQQGDISAESIATQLDKNSIGLIISAALTMFLTLFGTSIFNKVKKEKCSRIVEILATSVSGRMMMAAKIVGVAAIGLTQIALWLVILGLLGTFLSNIAFVSPLSHNVIPNAFEYTILAIAYFIGGYLFYASLYASCGAITDKDNENQGYVTLLTFMLLGSFYISQFIVNNPENPFTQFCAFFPFTSASAGCILTFTDEKPLWWTIVQLSILYLYAGLSITFAGKIYTSTILMNGRKLSLSDLFKILRMK